MCAKTVDKEKESPEEVRRTIFTTAVSEAAGLYNVLLSIATGLFAGTLLFLEKVAASPVEESLILLGLGWTALLACMVLSVLIRWKNIESCRKALDKGYTEASRVDSLNRYLTRLAILCLCLGSVSVGSFAFWNVREKVVAGPSLEKHGYDEKGNGTTMGKHGKEGKHEKKEGKIERSIPISSLIKPLDQDANQGNETVSKPNVGGSTEKAESSRKAD